MFLSWHGGYPNQVLLGRRGQQFYEGSSGFGSFPLISHRTAYIFRHKTGAGGGHTGTGHCNLFLTGQFSSAVTPTIPGVSKSAMITMIISCTSSPQKKCFPSTQWKCSPGGSSQKSREPSCHLGMLTLHPRHRSGVLS